jgi:hypothetical protein
VKRRIYTPFTGRMLTKQVLEDLSFSILKNCQKAVNAPNEFSHSVCNSLHTSVDTRRYLA